MSKNHSRAMDARVVFGEKTHNLITVAGPNPTLLTDILPKRNDVFFFNNGDVTVYIGKHDLDNPATDPPTVLSPLNGIPIAAGGDFRDTSSYDQWWAITADGAAGQLIVIESSVGGT